jgi:eukaryotic-like serine/threonine-protein kinase
MFINEARISALLHHPNIVQIYDFGQIDGWYFLAMEHLRGKDLLLVLRQLRAVGQVMPPPMAAFIAREVAAGLDYAHRLRAPDGRDLQIVHRDVSPSNVMLLRAGGVKLLDFGIAKAEALLAHDGSSTGENRPDNVMVKGKLSYLSPEQVRNEPIDARSDIFSLGVMFWECLTGKRLFYDKADFKTMSNVLERMVPPPSALRPDVPAAVDAVVMRALDRDREQRYQDAQAMADDLDQYLAESRFQPRMLPPFLKDLFGPDQTGADSLTGVPSAPLVRDPETPIITPSRPPATVTVAGLASFPPPGSRTESQVPAIAASPPGNPRTRPLALGLAGALIIGAFSAGLVLSNPPPPPDPIPVSSVYARPRLTPPAATGTAPAATNAPAAAPAAPDPSTVSLHLESDPTGAHVTDAEGRSLGVTPLYTRVPRSTTPLTFTLGKRGYQSTRHTLVPDGNLATVVSLRRRR